MPSWNDVLAEIRARASLHPIDQVRRDYLRKLAEYTDRNVIAYYSGWLTQTQYIQAHSINDEDKNAFMATIRGMERKRGLDLILHTPGGNLAAAESLVDYLRRMFGTDIRAVVPQIAMSAGTMLACATREIIMGKQSSLGPIDPQINGLPASGVIEEFRRAIAEIKADPGTLPVWQAIVGKYPLSFLGECEKAIEWAGKIVSEWLRVGMFAGRRNAKALAASVVKALSDRSSTFNHARHLDIDYCERSGLAIPAPGAR